MRIRAAEDRGSFTDLVEHRSSAAFSFMPWGPLRHVRLRVGADHFRRCFYANGCGCCARRRNRQRVRRQEQVSEGLPSQGRTKLLLHVDRLRMGPWIFLRNLRSNPTKHKATLIPSGLRLGHSSQAHCGLVSGNSREDEQNSTGLQPLASAGRMGATGCRASSAPPVTTAVQFPARR